MSFLPNCVQGGCRKRVVYFCRCQFPCQFICEQHWETHKKSEASSHIAQNILEPLMPSQKFSFTYSLQVVDSLFVKSLSRCNEKRTYKHQKLLQKIKAMNQYYSSKIEKIIYNYNQIRKTLTEILNLNGIPVISSNQTIQTINQLRKQNTLQNSLKTLLQNFSKATLQQFPSQPFSLSVHISSNKLSILNGLNKIQQTQILNIDKGSRCLLLSDSYLLVCGSYGSSQSSKSFVLQVQSKQVSNLIWMNIGRGGHAMAWIDHYPAVIGGYRSDYGLLDSVQLLISNQWKQYPPLSIRRQRHSACSYNQHIYVCGGQISNMLMTDSIQKFQNGNWKILQWVLPYSCWSPGFFMLKEFEILIIGGSQGGDLRKDLHQINTKTGHMRRLDHISVSGCFDWNLWVKKQGKMIGFTESRKLAVAEINLPRSSLIQ